MSKVRRVGGAVKAQYGHHWGGSFKKGRIGLMEVGALVFYVLASIAAFGLGSLSLSWLTDFTWLIVITTMLIVLSQKKDVTLTGVEVIGAIVAVVLPLAAAGQLTSVGIDISSYVASNGFLLFLISVAGAIVAATQD
jgi:hypothetical protein|uniref:VP3-like structural protein n=1 Tax=Pleomorphic virus ThalV2 TaxID=3115753 RepID=A0AAT9J7R5_9VIRU